MKFKYRIHFQMLVVGLVFSGFLALAQPAPSLAHSLSDYATLTRTTKRHHTYHSYKPRGHHPKQHHGHKHYAVHVKHPRTHKLKPLTQN